MYSSFVFFSGQLHLGEVVGARSLCCHPNYSPSCLPRPHPSCVWLQDILYFGASVRCTSLLNVLELVWENVSAFPRSLFRNVASLPALWSKL